MKLSTALALPLALTPLTAMPLRAQSTRVLPANSYRFNAGNNWHDLFATDNLKRQYLVEGRLFCNSSAVISEVAFRRNNDTRNLAARTIQLEVNAGHSKRTPLTLSRTFASNWSLPKTTVFKGSYALPALRGGAMIHPFNIRVKFTRPLPYWRRNGELLLEFSHTGSQNFTGYMLDGNRATTRARWVQFGKSGRFASGETSSVSGDGGYRKLGTVAMIGVTPQLKSPYPTLLYMGTSKQRYGALRLPFDLRPLGAPGNQLYVSLDVGIPLVLQRMPDDFGGTAQIAIPATPSLGGAKLYFQAIHLDRRANALGLVFSQALEFELEKWTPYALLTGLPNSRTGSTALHVPIFELTGSFN